MDIIDFSALGTVWVFIGFQYFILFFMFLFAYLVDDVTEEVRTCSTMVFSMYLQYVVYVYVLVYVCSSRYNGVCIVS